MKVLSGQSNSVNKEVRDKVILLSGSDPRIVKAKNLAKEGLQKFIKIVTQDQGLSKYDYSIKTGFSMDGKSEHMWIEVDFYKDGFFFGKIGNDRRF